VHASIARDRYLNRLGQAWNGIGLRHFFQPPKANYRLPAASRPTLDPFRFGVRANFMFSPRDSRSVRPYRRLLIKIRHSTNCKLFLQKNKNIRDKNIKDKNIKKIKNSSLVRHADHCTEFPR
jgi:hypothetical protein